MDCLLIVLDVKEADVGKRLRKVEAGQAAVYYIESSLPGKTAMEAPASQGMVKAYVTASRNTLARRDQQQSVS